MESHTANDWQYGFWSALSLELLARAALAHVSPVLLASKDNWRNLMYSLGGEPTKLKFVPSSIPANEVFARLSELVPEFTKETTDFCSTHANRRNTELHTGELAFAALGTSAWLPKFYSACKVLLESMDKSLSDLVSDPEAAQDMIEALEDAAVKAVKQDIKAHAKVWSNKTDNDRKVSSAQAIAWATRQAGHRVECPSCYSASLIQGSSSGTVTTNVDGDNVVRRQTKLPSSFECIACGLRISGFSKLSACGLGDAFTATTTYSAAEFFELYTKDELNEARNDMPEFEEDFNE